MVVVGEGQELLLEPQMLLQEQQLWQQGQVQQPGIFQKRQTYLLVSEQEQQLG